MEKNILQKMKICTTSEKISPHCGQSVQWTEKMYLKHSTMVNLVNYLGNSKFPELVRFLYKVQNQPLFVNQI